MSEAQDVVFFRTEGGIAVPAVTADQMREVDRIAVEEFGLGILQMMENAGRNLALNVMDMLDRAKASPEPFDPSTSSGRRRLRIKGVERMRSPSWRDQAAMAAGASAARGTFTTVVSKSGWCSTGIPECYRGLRPISSTSFRRPVCSPRIPPRLAS